MYETLAIAKPSKEGEFKTIKIKRGETGEAEFTPKFIPRVSVLTPTKFVDQVPTTLSLISSTAAFVTLTSTLPRMSSPRTMWPSIHVFQGTNWQVSFQR